MAGSFRFFPHSRDYVRNHNGVHPTFMRHLLSARDIPGSGTIRVGAGSRMQARGFIPARMAKPAEERSRNRTCF
jgi:hypothetical protein